MPSIHPGTPSGPTPAYGPPAPDVAAAKGTAQDEAYFGDDGFSFFDILDAINPLQHIPVVSSIYRAITGDEIAPGPRMAGGAIFGGPIGFVASLLNSAIEEVSGYDVGEHLIAMFEEDAPDTTAIAVATANPDQIDTLSAATHTERTPTQGYYQPAGLAVIEREVLPPPVLPPVTPTLYHVQDVSYRPQDTEIQEKAGAAAHVHTPDIIRAYEHAEGETAYGPQLPEAIGEQRISRLMLDALDKYEKMARERNADRARIIEEKLIF